MSLTGQRGKALSDLSFRDAELETQPAKIAQVGQANGYGHGGQFVGYGLHAHGSQGG